MSESLDDLFDDVEDQPQQQEQQQAEAESEGDEPAPAGSPEGEQGDEPAPAEDLLDPEPAADPDEQALFGSGSEDEAPPAPVSQPHVARGPAVEVAAPLISRPPKDQSYLLKLTNIVGVEPRPFHPDTYTTDNKNIYYDASGHRRVRLRDSNVIRWRYATAPDGSYLRNEAGQLVKESNARVIRWSDGSETLQLGGEMLALSKQNIQGDNAYLYAVHYDIIQGQAQLGTRVVLQPMSLKGGLHQKLKERVAVATKQQDKVHYHVPSKDPEAEKAAAEAAQKQVIRAGVQARRVQERFKVIMGRAPGGSAPAALTSDYLEGDDDYDDGGYDSDEGGRGRHYDEEEEEEAARRLQAAKRSEGGGFKRGRGGGGSVEPEELEEVGPGEEEADAGGIKRRKQTLLDDDDE